MKQWTYVMSFLMAMFSAVAFADMAPPMSNTTVLVWANEAIIKMNSYDFANYPAQLQGVSEYFTPDAWRAYSDALAKAKILETVTNSKLTVSSVAFKPPVIKESKAMGANYQWMIEMPTLVNFDSPNGNKQQRLNVQVVIVTATAPQGVRGLVIQSIVSRSMDEVPAVAK